MIVLTRPETPEPGEGPRGLKEEDRPTPDVKHAARLHPDTPKAHFDSEENSKESCPRKAKDEPRTQSQRSKCIRTNEASCNGFA